MVNEQVLAYVRAQLAAGLSKEHITAALATQGWTAQDVGEAFAALMPGQIVTPQPPVQPMPVAVPLAISAISPETKHTATLGKRLGNFFVDILLGNVIVFLFEALIHIGNTSFLAYFLDVSVMVIYYVFFESIWQRTPGKWITGTKVVRLDGGRPTLLQIVGRSLCRFIPFEILTFIFGAYPYGWHDRFSKTMVVSASYTSAEVASVNPRDKGKSKKGIIILVIVIFAIPVLGVFFSVFLTALNVARQKGVDAQSVSTTTTQTAQESQSPIASSTTPITKQVGGVTFTYPSNWITASSTNQNTLFTLELLQGTQLLARVGLLDASLGNVPFDQAVQQVAASLAAGGSMTAIQPLDFNGKTAEGTTITTTNGGQQVSLQCIFVDGGNGIMYLLEYAATAAQFNTFKAQAQQIMYATQLP